VHVKRGIEQLLVLFWPRRCAARRRKTAISERKKASRISGTRTARDPLQREKGEKKKAGSGLSRTVVLALDPPNRTPDDGGRGRLREKGRRKPHLGNDESSDHESLFGKRKKKGGEEIASLLFNVCAGVGRCEEMGRVLHHLEPIFDHVAPRGEGGRKRNCAIQDAGKREK